MLQVNGNRQNSRTLNSVKPVHHKSTVLQLLKFNQVLSPPGVTIQWFPTSTQAALCHRTPPYWKQNLLWKRTLAKVLFINPNRTTSLPPHKVFSGLYSHSRQTPKHKSIKPLASCPRLPSAHLYFSHTDPSQVCTPTLHTWPLFLINTFFRSSLCYVQHLSIIRFLCYNCKSNFAILPP